MSLKPQDVCILLKIVALGRVPWSYGPLAYELAMSASEVHAGVKRATEAGLMRLDGGWGYPDPTALEEFLAHGVRYAYAPERGGLTRGIPTSYAAPPLDRLLSASGEPPPVWPDAEGEVRGYAFSPLYKSVPQAARRDPRLYELLALVDAIRGGDDVARSFALRELHTRLGVAAPEDQDGKDEAQPRPRAAAKIVKRGGNGKEGRVYRRRH